MAVVLAFYFCFAPLFIVHSIHYVYDETSVAYFYMDIFYHPKSLVLLYLHKLSICTHLDLCTLSVNAFMYALAIRYMDCVPDPYTYTNIV